MYTRRGSDDVTGGGGVLLFNAFTPGTLTPKEGGFKSLGNTPVFNFTTATEKRDHWNSDGETKIRDVSIVTQLSRNGNITVDEISSSNLARMLFTDSTPLTTPAKTSTETVTLEPGSVIVLGATDAVPTGVRAIDPANLPVVTPVGGGAALVFNVDFFIDFVHCVLFIPFEGSSVVAPGDYTITTKSLATQRDYIVSKSTPLQGALMFLHNAQVGEKRKFYFPRIRLTPNGEFNLKADDWLTIPFQFEILQLPGKSDVYADGQPYL